MNLKLSKEEKGITLVALMVTIIVMLILAAVTINFSTTQIRNANLQNFKTNMLLIEAKAKEYVEKANYQLGVKPEEAINNPDLLSKSQSELQGDGKGTKVDASNSIVSTLKSINISDEDINNGNVYLLSTQDLEAMGLKDVKSDEEDGYFVLVYNILDASVKVYNTEGFSIGNGETKYCLDDIRDVNGVEE